MAGRARPGNVERHYRLAADLFHPRADYLLRVHGESMRDAGILDGDLLAVPVEFGATNLISSDPIEHSHEGAIGALILGFAMRRLTLRSLWTVLRSTGEHVAVSSVTTMVGFSGLIGSMHPGLRSIGYLAVLGIAMTLVAALVTLPALLYWLERRPAPPASPTPSRPNLRPSAAPTARRDA